MRDNSSPDQIPDAAMASTSPLLVHPTRVYRIYRGGALIDKYRAVLPAQDSDLPEDWVGSDTEAINPEPIENEGLSTVETPSGERALLKSLIQRYPEHMLGAAHVARWGSSTGLLVKLLDAAVRLPVHCHPDRDFARRVMGSQYGKTECWIVRDTRVIDGVEPYIALGFEAEVMRDAFAEWVYAQDGDRMLAALHRVTVQPGDVFFIPAGLPHAIGEGVLLIEVQEPSDWAVLAEYAAFGLGEEAAHQNRGWDLGLACFDYTTYSREAVFTTFKQDTPIIRREKDSFEQQLIAPEHHSFFGASQITVRGRLAMPGGRFSVGLTDEGAGKVTAAGGALRLQKGTTFVIPAGTGETMFESEPDATLKVTLCFPPSATAKE